MSDMMQFDAVKKSFTRRRPPALKGVSFTVQRGEVFGLLGHNGAGKSTAMGVMLGLVRPNAGEVCIADVSVQKAREKALQKVGAVFESPRFYEYLTGMKNLQIITAYSGFTDQQQMVETVELVGLSHAIHQKVGTYSQGMRQRLALAQALLPRPELLLLDEPTNGLDPDGIIDLRQRILNLRDEFGITVLLNSHMLNEVEQICDRVVIIREGETVFEGRCDAISADRATIYRVLAEDSTSLKAAMKAFGCESLSDQRWSLPGDLDAADLLTRLVGEGVRVRDFHEERATLEDVWLKVSQRDTGEENA